MRRETGPTSHQVPFMSDDVKTLKITPNLGSPDHLPVRRTTLSGLFGIQRISEILVTTTKNMSEERHPLRMREIEPLSKGAMAHFGRHVDEISIHISASKTDWANLVRSRPRTVIPAGAKNSYLCPAWALVELQEKRPVKFAIGIWNTFATW